MMTPIRLLVLGTGGMANTHAMNFATIADVQLVAAVDVDLAKVRAFAVRHDIPNTFTSLDEAIAWVKRCPNPMPGPSEIEIRPLFEADDFGEAFAPELREQEEKLRERLERSPQQS